MIKLLNTAAQVDPSEAAVTSISGTTFQITDGKGYVPIGTFQTKGSFKFSENLKQRFKRTIKWSKYRSETTAKRKDNNSGYLIDPTFMCINILFKL